MNVTSKFIFSFLLLLFFRSSYSMSASDLSTFVFKINGHVYNMQEDLFERTIQEWYDTRLDSIGLDHLVDSLARANNITITDFDFPDDVVIIYLEDSTGNQDITGKIIIENWTLEAKALGCELNSEISSMGIGFTARSEYISGGLRITDIETTIDEPEVQADGSGGFLCPILADTLRSSLTNILNEYLTEMADNFKMTTSQNLFDFINPVNMLNKGDPELVKAALKSFPMNMAMYTEQNTDLGNVQLIVDINFLSGTTHDSTAFIGVEPEEVTGSELKTGGFSFLYWVLQRGFLWHTDWIESHRVDAAFQIMDELDLYDYRLEVRWRDVQIRAYLGDHLHPDSVDMTNMDEFLTNSAFWDTSAFTNIKNILDDGSARNLNAFMAIGVGHQDRMPDDGTGNSIAPARAGWIGPENYMGVSANEYLYNLKIYAHATVKRFADEIDVWQVENELNAAGFAAADPDWWRKGDLWLDEEFRNRVWKVLVTAVRMEDPSALITHDLHMLGFMSALESWKDDLDIVGFNFYPNQASALPVLGFSVGEYVWAVRRALKGLDYPHKPVWLIETGYPGIESEDPPDSILIAEDIGYFSENRQREYIETALSSAVKNGVNGFFYYSLVTQENFDDFSPPANQFIRYSGLIRRYTDEPKDGLKPYGDLFKQLLLETRLPKSTENIPHSSNLMQNFPNPFNSATQIEYILSEKTDLEVIIYDIHGQVVTTLIRAVQSSGTHKLVWNASGYSSGVYFYQIKTPKFIQTRKMLLLQ